MPRRAYLTALAALVIPLVASCGFGAVEVEPYDVTAGSNPACSAVVEDLPEVVSDAVTRDVDPESLSAAAWGQPPIVLRCGVERPPEYRPDAVLTEIDGVAWLPIEGSGGMFFATVDRDPIVEIAIPDDYDPVDVLADLAPAISTHTSAR